MNIPTYQEMVFALYSTVVDDPAGGKMLNVNLAGVPQWKTDVVAMATSNKSLSDPNFTTLDGVTLSVGDRILLQNQTAKAENWIYIWGGQHVALVRASDSNTAKLVQYATVRVAGGTVPNINSVWQVVTTPPITLDTTALTLAELSEMSYIGTANRITVTGVTIDIAATYVGQTSITTLGTVATGAWNGTVISPVYGGTGIANNAASTLTISGNFATTLTVTGITSVTLPTTGTLVSSVTTGNGVSAVNTAGALAFTLGVITPTSVNGLTITSTTGTFTLTNAKTLTVSDNTTLAINSITLAGGEVITFSATNALSLLTTGTTVATLPLGTVTLAGQNFLNIFSVLQTNSVTGTASGAAEIFTGVPYAAGSTTTNYPLFYFSTTGATAATTWSAAGTYFGINAHSFTGHWLNFMTDNATVFNVDYASNINGNAPSGAYAANQTIAFINQNANRTTVIKAQAGSSAGYPFAIISDSFNGVGVLATLVNCGMWFQTNTTTRGGITNGGLWILGTATISAINSSVQKVQIAGGINAVLPTSNAGLVSGDFFTTAGAVFQVP